ncbi:HD domain-containing phosphohydrolase [Streptomyces sp. NPDC060194]|uniref:HD-GYP domain-containing protein n=1 Tax=Streptomyces sp. NPDC060194 TaxID=3347069 RepID=UPI0036472E63
MRGVPPAACAYIACAVVAAAVCAAPADLGRWGPTVAVLAALYAACERLSRRPYLGAFFPVLLAGAFLLPPAAAALVAVPGSLLSRVEQRPAWLRRVWRAAELALACWVAAQVHRLLGGPAAVAAADLPSVLLPSVVASLAFCVTLTALDGGVRALADRQSLGSVCRIALRRTPAANLVHGLAGLMMAVLWRSPYGPSAALLVLLPMYVSLWAFAQYHRERAAHQATIRALVQAVDIKDRYTRGHSERVGRASVMIARELGMDADRVEVLRFAGILHDVGKLGVPTRLLRKDGPLTPEERRVIELHPEYGHEMVRGIGFLGDARAAILHHHERMDGSGYPYGLRGEQIPRAARMVAVADAFDAMTSTRSYDRARPVEVAVGELRRCAGTQFDAEVVAAFTRAIERHGWNPAVTSEEPWSPGGPGAVPATGTPESSPAPQPSAAKSSSARRPPAAKTPSAPQPSAAKTSSAPQRPPTPAPSSAPHPPPARRPAEHPQPSRAPGGRP